MFRCITAFALLRLIVNSFCKKQQKKQTNLLYPEIKHNIDELNKKVQMQQKLIGLLKLQNFNAKMMFCEFVRIIFHC